MFITNIVKCRPPGNRNPLADEIAACNDWLSAQIALVEPKFIVAVGGPSLNTLVSKDLRITKARSNVFRKDGILFIPILHPAAALRSPDTMKLFLEDLANLKDFLSREIRPDEITEIKEKVRARRQSGERRRWRHVELVLSSVRAHNCPRLARAKLENNGFCKPLPFLRPTNCLYRVDNQSKVKAKWLVRAKG